MNIDDIKENDFTVNELNPVDRSFLANSINSLSDYQLSGSSYLLSNDSSSHESYDSNESNQQEVSKKN